MSGGRGGDATVIGSGTAIGGPGGHGGTYGKGGDGMHAKIIGDGLSAGGEGGSADSDNLWRPPARLGYEVAQEVLGLPVDPKLRKYGRGGMSPGYAPKYEIVDGIRIQYFKRHDLPYVDAVEDVTAVPLEYVNGELKRMNIPWRARIVRGTDYEFFIP